MRRFSFPKPYADAVARLRVPAGFVLLLAFLLLSAPTSASLAYGLPVSLLGVWLRGWAAGHLLKNERLATTGPYARVRNPLYLGSLLVATGLSVASRSIVLGVLFVAVFLAVYFPTIELEQQYLRCLFPGYEEYAARVPLLWPRLHGARAEGNFRWSLYIRNEEYRAMAAFLVGVAFLFWKAWK